MESDLHWAASKDEAIPWKWPCWLVMMPAGSARRKAPAARKNIPSSATGSGSGDSQLVEISLPAHLCLGELVHAKGQS